MPVSDRFIFVDIGRTGGTVVRNYLYHKQPGLIWLESTAHVPLSAVRHLKPTVPTFAYVRHPADWYIAYWIRDLEIHRWRGGFADWFFKRRHRDGTEGICFAKEWEWMTAPGVDLIGHFENLVENTVDIMCQVMPELREDDVRAGVTSCLGWSYCVQHMEGVEQWMRAELCTEIVREAIWEQDRGLFERFGYTFDEYYWFAGGSGNSAHRDVTVGDWEQERGLANWCSRPLAVVSGR